MNARAAVVFGGASGIGKAIARALREDDWSVTVADVNGAGADEVAAEIGGVGAQVDVTQEGAVEALLSNARQREGSIRAVVNTVGLSSFASVTDHDIAEWRRVIDVDLVGAMIVLKHAARVIEDGGSIVSLTSLNARQVGWGLSAYCAAKAGLSMLTQVAALELGPRGVRVNAIAPGLIMTPLTEGMTHIPGVIEDYVENTPLGRPGQPEEVAAAAVFLCSDKTAWLTGEVLDLNGGAHLMRYPSVQKHIKAAFG
jgi:NAD(P)-dependent dehydrogenase (short-subunit alcohol dehydrogenase family)